MSQILVSMSKFTKVEINAKYLNLANPLLPLELMGLTAVVIRPSVFHCTVYMLSLCVFTNMCFQGELYTRLCVIVWACTVYTFCPYVSEVRMIRGWHCSVPPRATSPCYFLLVSPCSQWGGWVRDLPPTHNHGRGRHPFHTTPLKCPQWLIHRPPQPLQLNSTFVLKPRVSKAWGSRLNPPLSPPHCDTDS